MKRLKDYDQYRLLDVDVLQGACVASHEQVNYVLNESRGVRIVGERINSVIPIKFDASEELARLCYCVVRLAKPLTVVETGVGRGVTSYYILRAMEKNAKGRLYSIELPMLRPGAKEDTGKLVPASLRFRWELIYGPGVYEMKKLRKKLESIDMFLHDSDHSYAEQLAEYQIALSWLKKGGVLISDDVGNDAILEASEQFGTKLMVTKQSKVQYVGVITK